MPKQPDLQIHWDPDWTGEIRLVPNPTGVLVPTRRFHMVVENVGSETARDCRGYIEAIETLGDGSRTGQGFKGRLPLTWARSGGRTRTDIEPSRDGAAQRLFLCAVPLNAYHFQVMSPAATISARHEFAVGRYRITVSVGGGNAATKTCHLVIDFAGNADSMEIREVTDPGGSITALLT